MMKDVIFRKGLVCAVIFLFIGLAFVPIVSSNITKTISGNGSAEFIVQACGVKGVKPKIVRLTSQQVSKLDNYVDSLKSRLENATTDDEVTNILNGAVIELNKYGLLPEHMNVEKAQQLVVNKYKNQVTTPSEDKENFNCQVIGKTRQHFDNEFDKRMNFWDKILDKIIDSFPYVPGYILLVLLIAGRLAVLEVRFLFFKLIKDNELSFGRYHYYWDYYYPPEERYTPDLGWVRTYNGSNGNVSWSGDLWGLIRQSWEYLGDYYEQHKDCYFIGMENFTGISIFDILPNHNYFFGSASHVKLGPNPPPLNPN